MAHLEYKACRTRVGTIVVALVASSLTFLLISYAGKHVAIGLHVSYYVWLRLMEGDVFSAWNFYLVDMANSLVALIPSTLVAMYVQQHAMQSGVRFQLKTLFVIVMFFIVYISIPVFVSKLPTAGLSAWASILLISAVIMTCGMLLWTWPSITKSNLTQEERANADN